MPWKWVKSALLAIGIVSLVFIAKDIQQPFWNESNYQQVFLNFQKDQDIFPYRIRILYWNNSILLKFIVQRSIEILWSGSFFYIPLISVLILIKKKSWLSLTLVIIGIALISIENDPNPGKYIPWLIPLIISGFIK